jgi:thymidylate synthase
MTKKTISDYERDYRDIGSEIIGFGVERPNNRTGVVCYSAFSQHLNIDIRKGFPLLTGRKMFEKTFKTEFEWFINGETNIRRFQEAGVKIWDAWADEFGDLGPVYGYQMLNFNNQSINQLEAVIHSLKHDRDSRRHIISLWNPAQLTEMKLPPCYLYFQFFVEDNGDLNMFVLQRSADWFLGVPYDVALFSMILLYIAEKTNLNAKLIDIVFVDAHIYENHIENFIKYCDQKTYNSPKYTYENGNLLLKNYKFGPVITGKVAV